MLNQKKNIIVILNHWLFKLRGDLNSSQRWILAIAGMAFFLFVWFLLTLGNTPLIPRGFFPSPQRVFYAYGDLFGQYELIKNTSRSIGLNLGGYIKAIAYAVPIGFLIGLVPMFRGAFQRMVDAIRFIPLTALTGLFIIWYGIESDQKINFLAFGIFIYLLPIVIQRIDEVDDVYLKTVHTLGAKYFQTIWTVYVPAVVSRLIDDVRILTAISWTYIIVAETSGDQGGLGSLIFRVGQRLSRVDITIACLLLIMIIGVFQDKIFGYLDRKFFPYKYQAKNTHHVEKNLKEVSVFDALVFFLIDILTWVFIATYILLTVNEGFPFLGGVKPLGYLFGDALWTIHTVFIMILSYQLIKLYNKIILKE